MALHRLVLDAVTFLPVAVRDYILEIDSLQNVIRAAKIRRQKTYRIAKDNTPPLNIKPWWRYDSEFDAFEHAVIFGVYTKYNSETRQIGKSYDHVMEFMRARGEQDYAVAAWSNYYFAVFCNDLSWMIEAKLGEHQIILDAYTGITDSIPLFKP